MIEDGSTSEPPSRNTRGKGLIASNIDNNRVALGVGRAYMQCAFKRRAGELYHVTINNYDLSRRGGLKIICSRLHRCGSLRWWHVIRGRRELWLMHICCISSSLSQLTFSVLEFWGGSLLVSGYAQFLSWINFPPAGGKFCFPVLDSLVITLVFFFLRFIVYFCSIASIRERARAVFPIHSANSIIFSSGTNYPSRTYTFCFFFL